MNRTTIVVMLLLASAASALAQTAPILKPKRGRPYRFQTSSELSATQSVGQQQNVMRSSAASTIELKPNKIAKGRIEWLFGVSAVRIVSQNSLGEKNDTTMKAPPQRFVTDDVGRIIEAPKRSNDWRQLLALLGGESDRALSQWFLPRAAVERQPGATWQEPRVDTIDIAEGQQGSLGSVPVYTRYVTTYIYDGVVDTLGVKAMRIRWAASDMAIEGRGRMWDREVRVDGEANSFGVGYFSLVDGILVTSSSSMTTETRLTIAGADGGSIPTSQTVTTSTKRM